MDGAKSPFFRLVFNGDAAKANAFKAERRPCYRFFLSFDHHPVFTALRTASATSASRFLAAQPRPNGARKLVKNGPGNEPLDRSFDKGVIVEIESERQSDEKHPV